MLSAMESFQLEFNFENKSAEENYLSQMQRQIDTACGTMSKVRRKLFAELGAMRDKLDKVTRRNESLEREIMRIKGEKIEWLYCQDDFLITVHDRERAIS